LVESLSIHRVTELDLSVTARTWPFAEARRAEISAHFAAQQRQRSHLWNGRVLIGTTPVFAGERLSASYFAVDFASFLAWRDWGFPDKNVFNGFGMGALRASDGAFVLGEMNGQTANAGRVYFPSGTPDLDDVKDGRLDMPASVAREVEEETGLGPHEYRAASHWDCIFTGVALAMIRRLDVDLGAEALRAKIEDNIARQSSPELSAVHLVRRRSDLTGAMPRFVTAWLEAQLPA
jgi:8-oxo-dGTP pyrophosphatase MutT (NUDIX family)